MLHVTRPQTVAGESTLPLLIPAVPANECEPAGALRRQGSAESCAVEAAEQQVTQGEAACLGRASLCYLGVTANVQTSQTGDFGWLPVGCLRLVDRADPSST